MAVITDLGKYDNYLIDKLQDLDVLLLEANHKWGNLIVSGKGIHIII